MIPRARSPRKTDPPSIPRMPPIVYPVALTKAASPAAHAFLDYLNGSEAKAIFEKAGFTVR
jgi:ABC-type molybdate transport system substrate-binding protein